VRVAQIADDGQYGRRVSMKIRDAKTYVVANPPPHHAGPYFVFIKLRTDDNVHGFGEVYGAPFAPDRLPPLIDDVIERHVTR
jgi:L-alanine-DL-glutamate epimerase-like enolase superfamily enzyme